MKASDYLHLKDNHSQPYGWASTHKAGKARGASKGKGAGFYAGGRADVASVPRVRAWASNPGRDARSLNRLAAKGGMISAMKVPVK
jgi:hypothetical protein